MEKQRKKKIIYRAEIMKRKALSPVITTVLLILVSVTAIVIISGVIIPFVRNSLTESKECFETAGQLTINTNSGYTCYYEDDEKITANITIKRGSAEIDLERFKISVSAGGIGKSFDIKSGETGVSMLGGGLEIPDAGEERTYSITTGLNLAEGVYAEVYPVMKSGKLCDSTDTAELEEC
ncbi:MAG TPA: hypothetical protein VMZ91_00875 [Candidatus Paceibacterota bacterium]|nr:hypothetical protein [Candidatus Paceibacterota bacterium]